jgi:hypothetical protein
MSTIQERAARERKQKIFVIVGAVLLLGLLAIQLPKLLGGPSEPSATSTTTATDTVAGEATTTEPQSPALTAPVALVNTDHALAPGPGQLSSFSTFKRKDPFVQLVKVSEPAVSGASKAAGSGEKGGEAKTSSKGFTVGGTPAASVTVISVNGDRQALAPGAAFPASDPVFVLVSEQLKAKTVMIAVAGGAYENGAKTTKLRVGKPLVLVNTTTGARYRLVLVAVGSGTAPQTAGKGSESDKSTPPATTP